jgi:hypothetical protein
VAERVLGIGPEDVAGMSRETLLAVLAETQAIQLAAWSRLSAPAPQPNGEHASDGCISVDEAARMTGLTREQFLRRKAFRPALVNGGHRTRAVNKKIFLSLIEQRSGT